MSAEHPESTSTLDRMFLGGLAWTAGSKWLTQGLTWISVFVVARLLSPSDFGLVEMAGTFFIIANVLAEFGIGTGVVQIRDLSNQALAQLNSLSIFFAALTYGIALLTAPWIADFFRSEKLEILVATASVVFFITGFQTVPMGVLRRDLDYRRLSIAEAVQSIVQAVATVVSAWLGLAYWALIIGPVLGKASSTILAMVWTRIPFHWPRLEVIRAPLKFGYHVSVANLAGTVSSMSDAVVVGRRMGDALLGHYRMALTLAYAPIDKVGSLIMRVTGPLFAKIQSDQLLMRRYFLVFTETLACAIFPMSVGIALVAPEIVATVLGGKWEASVGPLRYLSLFAGIRLLSILVNQILIARHRTAFTMHLSLLALAVMPLVFWIAAGSSLAAVGASWLVLAFINLIPSYVVMAREIALPLKECLNALVPSSVACMGMALGIYVWRVYMPFFAESQWANLLMQVALGAILYAGILLIFFRSRFTRYIAFAQSLRRGRVPE
ncbi:MAG: lipopolysaccharide biosynthesis protein [Bryobacterales bacterium]|nr:lipopolysaccharide biosynthesis protein [Bryobacterales bacterium]